MFFTIKYQINQKLPMRFIRKHKILNIFRKFQYATFHCGDSLKKHPVLTPNIYPTLTFTQNTANTLPVDI